LIDQEAIYAPRQGNDRLLLGLKGSLNEYELDLLRQRSLAACYQKARRGELVVTLRQDRGAKAREGSGSSGAGSDQADLRQVR
jgi:DNA invertase Pin-like site-specific DNA recombinase